MVLVIAGLLLAAPGAAAQGPQSASFAFNWEGNPEAPQTWAPQDWDVVVHARDDRTWSRLDPVPAQHGPDCSPPPATHLVTGYNDAVFICRNHMMTGFMPGGYGEIEFAPDHLADWSTQTTVINWRVSTFRTSPRDWIDVLVTPLDENLVLPAHTDVDLNGRPRDAIHVEMSDSVPTKFRGTLLDNFQASDITTGGPALEDVVPPSAVKRARFQLEITRTHIRFGLPETGTWWIDRDVPALKFSRGLVQLGHHSYTPDKECTPKPDVLSCTGNTWHWSDFSISSAVPFTMLRGQPEPGQHVSRDTSPVVLFRAPAPPDSHLRFAAVGRISVSFDGERSWTEARPQPSERNQSGNFVSDKFSSYWLPVPAGTTAVTFRGQDPYFAPWWVKDPAIWSEELAPAAEAPAPAAAATPPTAPPAVAAENSAKNEAKDVASTAGKSNEAETRWGLVSRVRRLMSPVVAAVLPLVVLAGGGAGLVWWLRRRRRLSASRLP